jgi:hypothetical protein
VIPEITMARRITLPRLLEIHNLPDALEQAVVEVINERKRQMGDPQPGKVKINWQQLDRLNTRNDWSSYITRYTGRATDERALSGWTPESFRTNMIKVAATALAAVQAFDEGAACSHAPA